MNRYGQIRDLLLGDLTTSIFIFGVIVTVLVLISIILSNKEKIDYDKESTDEIINKIAHSIEQHETFLKVIPQKELKKENELNKKREF